MDIHMPQPLARVHPTLGFELANGNLVHTPEMALAVTGVINLWAQIDQSNAFLLSQISGSEPVITSAMLQTLTSAEAKKRAILAAAKAACSHDEYALIRATLERFTASRNHRNDFAHHLWGRLNTRDDCVILADPKVVAAYTAATTSWIRNRTGTRPDIDRNQVMVWTLRDFEIALEDAREAHGSITRLPLSIGRPPSQNPMQAQLLTDPKIRRLYDRYLVEKNI